MEEVNVTEVPAQTGLAEDVMVMLTGNNGFTVMITGLEIAGEPVAQVALEVRMHLITSLLTGR
jgi:hypothetical protein